MHRYREVDLALATTKANEATKRANKSGDKVNHELVSFL